MSPEHANSLLKGTKERLREAHLLKPVRTLSYLKRRLVQLIGGYPRMLTVEASSWCNLDCDFCVTRELKISDKREQRFLSFEAFAKLVDQTRFFCSRLNFSLFGEPLANPELPRMIAYAEANGMFTTLFTNATFLTDANIRKLLDAGGTRIIASFESFDRPTYESTKCGADQDAARRQIERFMQLRKQEGLTKPQLVLRAVLTRRTIDQVESYIEDARSLGVDAVSIKPLTIWPQGSEAYKKKMMDELVVDHPISRYEKDSDGQFKLRARTVPCPSLYTPAILSDGRVCLCWYDMLAQSCVGNIHETDFVSIWKQSATFRRNQLASGKAYDLCANCPGIGAHRGRTVHFD